MQRLFARDVDDGDGESVAVIEVDDRGTITRNLLQPRRRQVRDAVPRYIVPELARPYRFEICLLFR